MGCWLCQGVQNFATVYTDPVTRKEYCLLHAPADRKGMDTSEFNNIIIKTLGRQADNLSAGLVDLSGTVFPGDIRISDYENSLSMGGINLSGAVFNGIVTLCDAIISGPFLAYRTRFLNKVFFNNSEFKMAARFDDAEFHDDCLFCQAEFRRICIFEFTQFNMSLSFTGTKFKRGAKFDNTKIKFFAEFEECNISSGKITFSHLSAYSISQLLLPVNVLPMCSFYGCSWPQKIAYDMVGDNLSHSYIKCSGIYTYLKKTALEMHDQPLVSRWHFREKLMQLKQMFNNDRSNDLLEAVEDTESPWAKRARAWLLLLWHRPHWPKLTFTGLYWATSGFGERYIRAGVWLAVFLLLPFLVAWSPIPSGLSLLWAYVPGAQYVNDFMEYLSTSVNATAAMRYIPFTKDIGGAGASGWLKVGQGLWQCLIIVQFSLFALAVRNHFRR